MRLVRTSGKQSKIKPVQHVGIITAHTKRQTEDFPSPCLLQVPSNHCLFLLTPTATNLQPLFSRNTGNRAQLCFSTFIARFSLHPFLQLFKRACASGSNAPSQCPTAHFTCPILMIPWAFGCIPSFVCC